LLLFELEQRFLRQQLFVFDFLDGITRIVFGAERLEGLTGVFAQVPALPAGDSNQPGSQPGPVVKFFEML